MFVFTENQSIANHFIAELRDKEVQKDSWRFRKNLERMGNLMAYELSKSLNYQEAEVKTPLGTSKTKLLEQQPVLAVILRAGLPFYQGFLDFFDKAESAFVGAYRGPLQEDNSFDIVHGYTVTPHLDDKVLVMLDPMLATGKSIVSVYESLMIYGKPREVHVVAVIASKPGVQYVCRKLPDCKLWLGAVDDELNEFSYIIPGLGDAGDLAFGNKQP